MDSEILRFSASGDADVSLRATLRGEPAAPVVVLLHGGGANQHWWDRIAPALARHYRVAALDFRGHGDSDHPEKLLVGAFHRDLEALLTHLGRDDVALVGHSLGGHVALDHAARHPGVWAVVAIEVSRGGERRVRRRTRLALAARRSYASRDEAIARYRLLPDTPGAPESLRRELAGHSVAELPDGRFGFKFDPRWFALPPAPAAPLADVRCPCLVVRGAESTLLTPEGARALAADLPSARVVEIAGGGHNVHLEQPAAVIEATLAHLAAHAPGGG